jgi:hypothetical protein
MARHILMERAKGFNIGRLPLRSGGEDAPMLFS